MSVNNIWLQTFVWFCYLSDVKSDELKSKRWNNLHWTHMIIKFDSIDFLNSVFFKKFKKKMCSSIFYINLLSKMLQRIFKKIQFDHFRNCLGNQNWWLNPWSFLWFIFKRQNAFNRSHICSHLRLSSTNHHD